MALPTLSTPTGPQVMVTSGSPITLPAAVIGDSIVIIVSSFALTAFTLPAPWVQLAPLTTAGSLKYAAYAAPYAPGLTAVPTCAPSQNMQITRFVVSGARPPADWVKGTIWPRSGHGTSTTTIAPSITAVYDETLCLGIFCERTSAAETDVSGVAGATKLIFLGKDPTNANIETTTLTTETLATAGVASGDTTVTYPNVQASNGVAQHIGIPAVAAAPPSAGLPALDGLGADVEVWYTTDGAGSVDPVAALVKMERGFDDVAQVLAKPGFTMAHRGGSARWPECSLHGYTQSVRRGYGLLEFSVARSSDGVLFGLHDQTLNRTSQTSGLPDVSTMTWAAISAYSNTLAAQGGPQPYLRLEDYIDAYGDSHVHMVDPKYLTAPQRAALWAQLISDVGADRIIAKYWGGGPEVATQASALGLTTWGYFYAANLTDGTWAADKGVWDILGLEYSATQPQWDTVLAEGKPAIAHIAPDQAAYDLAITRGADGVQCAGVHVIEPVSRWTP